jgi:tetratricopeptide (TPR) repeat protein
MSLANLTKLKRKAAELEQKKQFDKALQLYIQIIDESGRDLEDADLQLFNRVGDLLLRAGTVAEALAYYEKAVDMYAERGFLNNAIALCNKILRQSPARTAVYYKLGKISASKGFKSDAKKNFLEYADRVKKSGQVEEAFRALKELAELCPDQDDIRLMLADLLSKENRSSEALEQLERLYHQLDAEGRDAEARATLERIKAIDPNVTLRASGSVDPVKANDLVFLDLTEEAARPAPRPEVPPTPVEPLPVAKASAVVPALEGLTLTFVPDDEEAERVAGEPALVGFEATSSGAAFEAGDAIIEPDSSIEHLETVESLLADEQSELQGAEAELADEIVPHLEGLESTKAVVAGVDPVLTPLVDAPPLLSREFADLELVSRDTGAHQAIPHDLAIGSSLPTLRDDEAPTPEGAEPTNEAAIPGESSLISFGLGGAEDDMPDEWVKAALGAPRDDARFDQLLAPLASLAIPSDAAGGASYAETLLDGEPLPTTPAAVPAIPDARTESRSAEHQAVAAPEDVADAVAAAREEAELVELALSAAAAEAAGQLQAESALREPSDAGAGPGEFDLALSEGRPHFDAPTQGSADHGLGPALDLSSLADHPDRPTLGRRSESEPADPPTELGSDSADLIQSAFSEEAVSLPLIDLDRLGDTDDALDNEEGFTEPSADLEDILSSPPAFGEPAYDPDFQPAPPMGLSDDWTTAETPEVLIDGEWRDEHVGDLVSGEKLAIPPGHEPPTERPVFDDLAAAMMYPGDDADDDEPRDARELAPSPTAPQSFAVRATPSRTTLSFGGVEAQLRRRLELDPTNWGLQRLLGEALLDQGDREAGLNALDEAMRGFEAEGDLPSARGVVDVILMVVPLSVRHHQKRVEYAVRANDRVLLVEAYAELADALFRCGDAGKARVVYGRVLDLAPTFERARLALQLLDGGRPAAPRTRAPSPASNRASTPSVDLATLATADTEDSMPTLQEALSLPLLDERADDGSSQGFDALDREIDSAFTPRQENDQRSTPAGPAVELPPAAADFLDLSTWVQEATPSRSTRMVANDVVPSGDEDADFEEMLRRFKQGLAENVDEEDYASHYDLGIAFKEMGLIDEAIAQFQKALRGDRERIRAYEALGQCFVEKGQHQVATTLLKRALETTETDDRQLVGVLYLLGYSSEALARHAEAAGYYQRVFAVDVEFRDAAARLAAIERHLR